MEYIAKVVVESYEEQVKFGRMRLDATEGVYRPTLVGAYCMTWPLLWPGAWFANAKMKAREEKILNAFRASHGSQLGATQATSQAGPWS
jgi:hypothetical protein